MPAIITGTLNNSQQIPLPQGYEEKDCKQIVSVKQEPKIGNADSWEFIVNIKQDRKVEVCERTGGGYICDKPAQVFYLVICQKS